jgi:hypothetical protein
MKRFKRSQRTLPGSFWIGQELDWDAPRAPAWFSTELPFWLMVADCRLQVYAGGHTFTVQVTSSWYERHADVFADSKTSCIYQGPDRQPRTDSQAPVPSPEAAPRLVVERKCKTLVRIGSPCNEDVLTAHSAGEPARRRQAVAYLQAACHGHIPIINALIQRYRMVTYDYFAYEVSAWDVPVWFITDATTNARVIIHPYREWDSKPQIGTWGTEETEEYELIAGDALQNALSLDPSPGEYDLLDAGNLMERGDFSGAVRRTTTAIEAIVAARLRVELAKFHPEDEVERRMLASQNDVPGRIRQLAKLTGRAVPEPLDQQFTLTRAKRHAIVHQADRIAYADRGEAQRMVDSGRWLYNWFEDRPDRTELREKLIAKRSLGRAIPLYAARLGPGGVTVERPTFRST